MNDRERIGKRIAQLRMEAGISQYKLAEITGIAPGNIARIELGKYSTGVDLLSKIGDALGYKLDFTEKENPCSLHPITYHTIYIFNYQSFNLNFTIITTSIEYIENISHVHLVLFVQDLPLLNKYTFRPF